MAWSQIALKIKSPCMFLIGGGINTAFSFLIYLGLLDGLGYQLAYFISYFLGIVIAYWFNTIIVFRSSLSWKGLISYPLVYAFQYLVSALFMNVVVERLQVTKSHAPLIVVALMLPMTYMMSKFVIGWSRRRKECYESA